MNLVAKNPRSSAEVPTIGRVEERVRVKVFRFISFLILIRNVFCFWSFYRHGAGVATPDPGEAPPLAGFSELQMSSKFSLASWKARSHALFIRLLFRYSSSLSGRYSSSSLR